MEVEAEKFKPLGTKVASYSRPAERPVTKGKGKGKGKAVANGSANGAGSNEGGGDAVTFEIFKVRSV